MSKTLRAIYENGVLRPLEALDLRENQEVAVVLTPSLPSEEDWLDTDCLALYAGEADNTITLEAVREALSKIPGSLTADFIAERDEE